MKFDQNHSVQNGINLESPNGLNGPSFCRFHRVHQPKCRIKPWKNIPMDSSMFQQIGEPNKENLRGTCRQQTPRNELDESPSHQKVLKPNGDFLDTFHSDQQTLLFKS